MRERLREDLAAALKARDAVAVSALRSALAAIDNAEAIDETGGRRSDSVSEHIAGARAGVYSAEASRRELDESDLRKIVEAEVDDRTQQAEQYREFGHKEAAQRLRSEARILREYLG